VSESLTYLPAVDAEEFVDAEIIADQAARALARLAMLNGRTLDDELTEIRKLAYRMGGTPEDVCLTDKHFRTVWAEVERLLQEPPC
jgi:hypothetical protein